MGSLEGKRVLLVEDEAILAMALQDLLEDLGCKVVGPAMSLSQAQRLAACEELDAAVLDINMGEGTSFPAAELLRGRHVPFCFATGYGASGVPQEYCEVPVIQKPYTQQSLAGVLRRLVS